MSNLTKPPDSPPTLSLNKGKLTAKVSPFQQRVNAAKAEAIDPATMPNRICLMLDRSSSMSSREVSGSGLKPRIDLLKDAVQNFVARCSFADTAIAIETFPPSVEIALSANPLMLSTAMFALEASGNTPMRKCVSNSLDKVPMTRGIIVSDGEATDWHNDFDDATDLPKSLLTKYKNAGIPIDTVHIGNSHDGEELLRRIARETGGLYLKFTDVSAFSNAFGFLTPGYRAMLTDGRISAELLGARELLK